MTDLCSGWRTGGVACESVRLGRGVPVQDCPPATDLGGSDPKPGTPMPVLRADWIAPSSVCRCLTARQRHDEIWGHVSRHDRRVRRSEVVLHEYSLSLSLVTSDDEGP